MSDEFPSNSRMVRASSERGPKTPRKVKQITQAIIISEKKKPLLLRIFGDNTKSMGEYVIWDVLIPAMKNTLNDMVQNGLEMMLFGETRSRNLRRERGRTYVSYDTKFSYKDREPRRERTRSIDRHKFEGVVLPSRAEAEEVLGNLVDLIEDYNLATVADFYDMVGLQAEWSDNKYGWDNLSRASVARTREGYVLEMPRPVILD